MTTCPRCGRDPEPRSKWRMLAWVLGGLGILAMLVAMLLGR
jgi:hypothetical protein